MSSGMTFKTTNSKEESIPEEPTSEETTPTVINLTDILTQDFDDLGDWGKDEEEVKQDSKEVRITREVIDTIRTFKLINRKYTDIMEKKKKTILRNEKQLHITKYRKLKTK